MFNLLLESVARVMSWLFIIGVAGCIFVIPYTAYQLFSVLVEKDAPEETDPLRQRAV